LLRPKITSDIKIKTLNTLDSIAKDIRTEKISFEAAAAFMSSDKDTKMNNGIMTNQNSGSSKFEYQDLPSEIAKYIYAMQEGDVSEPFVMIDRMKNKEICAIVKLKARREAHKANLVDDFQVVRQMLEQKRSAEVIDQWIREKQKEIYVQIDPAWRGCDFEYPGWVK
jgi:peptidyl-prolyl cis-trans isomerase SurA